MTLLTNFLARLFSTEFVTVIALLCATKAIFAQTSSPAATFEVETVREGSFDPTTYGRKLHYARVSYRGMTLKELVSEAYGVDTTQISGPSSIDTTRFDIEATMLPGTSPKDVSKMLQELLTRRFMLSSHVEKRELDTYALIVGKHGAKLVASPPEAPAVDQDATLARTPTSRASDDQKVKRTTNKDGSSTIKLTTGGTETVKVELEKGIIHDQRSRMSMEEFAAQLEMCFEGELHKVQDQTGIAGYYQIAWDCPVGGGIQKTRRDASIAEPSDPRGIEPLERSLDALGLKLVKRRLPVDVYVVNHYQTPSSN